MAVLSARTSSKVTTATRTGSLTSFAGAGISCVLAPIGRLFPGVPQATIIRAKVAPTTIHNRCLTLSSDHFAVQIEYAAVARTLEMSVPVIPAISASEMRADRWENRPSLLHFRGVEPRCL